MRVLLEIRNREMEFVAAAMISVSDNFDSSYVDEVADEALSDALMELDWEEDQSKINAVEVLGNTLYSIYSELDLFDLLRGTDEIIGITVSYNGKTDSLAKEITNLNIYKELDFGKSSSIILNEDWLNDAMSFCDRIVSRATTSVDEDVY